MVLLKMAETASQNAWFRRTRSNFIAIWGEARKVKLPSAELDRDLANRSLVFRTYPDHDNAITELCVGGIASKTDLCRRGFRDIGLAPLTP
jgi:hypothetical protein